MSRYVIIGCSAAGIHAAEEIRRLDAAAVITMVSDEPFMPYRRYRIADVLGGQVREREIIYRNEDFFAQQRIEVIRSCAAERVNTVKRYVALENKSRLSYDALIIASGARPRLPRDVKGTQRFGVAGLHALGAVKDMQDLMPISHLACVWGCGVAGAQAAAAFKARGLDVRIVEPREQILDGVLSAEAQALVAERLRGNGIEIVCGQNITELMGNGDVKAIRLSKGKVIGCGIVAVDMFHAVCADFLGDAGVAVQPEGIVTDTFLRTTDSHIYCAGDAALVPDAVTGIPAAGRSWGVAAEQGTLAGHNAVMQVRGTPEHRTQYPGMICQDQFSCLGVTVLAVGARDARGGQGREMLESRGPDRCYRNIIVQGERLVGFTAVGESVPPLKPIVTLMRAGSDIAGLKDRLLAGEDLLSECAAGQTVKAKETD